MFTGLPDSWKVLLYLLVALVLSTLVGAEREVRQKSAGLRTHTLVGIGAALFTVVSKYGFSDVLQSGLVVLDPSPDGADHPGAVRPAVERQPAAAQHQAGDASRGVGRSRARAGASHWGRTMAAEPRTPERGRTGPEHCGKAKGTPPGGKDEGRGLLGAVALALAAHAASQNIAGTGIPAYPAPRPPGRRLGGSAP